MGANGSLAALERGSTTGLAGEEEKPRMVTCVVIAERGVRVVAVADVDERGGAEEAHPDFGQLAEILETAASALRGERALVVSAGSEPAIPVRRVVGFPAEPLRVGQLEIHPESRLVVRAGQPVPLSRIEFDLFLALVRREGAAATRLELVREVWGFGAAVTSRSVDTQIYNLRHKLEENPTTPRHLLTVSGIGYRVAP